MTRSRPVLIVEDDDDTREALRELLRAEGFDILTAENGFEAIQKALAHDDTPCVIILDDRMPLMNGLEFLAYRDRHTRLAGIPVIFVSGDADTIRQVSERGAKTFRKPFAVDAFIESVREHCA
jgi:DNA-binding NtrC family response regulator